MVPGDILIRGSMSIVLLTYIVHLYLLVQGSRADKDVQGSQGEIAFETIINSTAYNTSPYYSTKLHYFDSGAENYPKITDNVHEPSHATSNIQTRLVTLDGVTSPADNMTAASELPIPGNTTHAAEDEDFYEEYDDMDDRDEKDIPAEQRLMKKLLRYYERSVRPARNASETVTVKMGLTMTQIFDMDEKNQVLVTNVWLDQEWDDIFLTWEPEEFGGLKTLRLPCHKLWLPDIVLYNNGAEYADGLMPANAMIRHDGNVFWPVPAKLQSTCKVDVTYFPFDDQQCVMKFGSWTYDGFQVDMVNRTEEVDLSNYVENGEWELLKIEVHRNVVRYACCAEPFPDVTFIIHIRRRTIYYLYNIIFPCIMMSVLTLLVFCLPPDSGEKVTMGITVMLAFSVFLLRMGEDLPETSEFIPLLSIYLTTVMGITSISVIMTVFVLSLHHRGPREKPVPHWLRKLFLHKKVKRGLCFKRDSHYVDQFFADSESRYVKNVSLRLTIENLAQELKEELDNMGSDFITETPSLNTERFETTHFHDLQPPEQPARRPLYFPPPLNNRTNGDILDALKKIIERYERDDSEEELMYEWRQVATGVDRILFWVFLVGTITSTVVVLVIAPVTRFI